MAVAEQPRLLVVDDEEAICEGCRRVLTRQGFAVDKTSDPREGLSRATTADYAAILLDIKMPEMDGLDFLSRLRTQRPDTPVILMTGFPSVPTAVSAISLGAAGYVTKPFTPEEITQAVNRFATPRVAPAEAAADPETTAEPEQSGASASIRFWHNAWMDPTPQSTYRCGVLLGELQADDIQAVQLPKLGEVVYQGLPIASVTTSDGTVHVIDAPLTGVIEAVNEDLADGPGSLISDPCTTGWIAEVRATRDEAEAKNCIRRNVLVLAADADSAARQTQRLNHCGCATRAFVGQQSGPGWEELAQRLASEAQHVVLLDAASLGEAGPKMAAQLNIIAPACKIIVVASSACAWEAAYRSSRIFYYVVEPFAGPEIAEVLNSAFAMPVVRRGRENRSAPREGIARIEITNRQGEDVILLVAPGVLYRNHGLGAEIRGLIYDGLYPVQTIPGKANVAPRDVLNLAHKFDRVLVLESRDTGRLPGTLLRDKGTELANLGGDAAGCVTTLLVQPPGDEPDLDALESRTIAQLARHLVDVMAGV